MTPLRIKHISFLAMLIAGVFSCVDVYSQGRVIINEFMSSSGCPQYIELKNLGPGRENIGCYIIASEIGAITIPQNTWLDPGDLYLIAGTNQITNCGTSPAVQVNLNWTSCGGCSTPSMTTTTSFFGSRNSQNSMYPLVLFNSSSTPTVIDAVSEGSIVKDFVNTNSFTTGASGCTNRTINLSTLNKNIFEDTGPAPGTNASASRKIDGSCEWDKSANRQTPGFSNTIGGVTTNPIIVSSNYSLTCLGGDNYNATQQINISLSGISEYYLSTAYATDSIFTQNLSVTPSTLSTQTSISLSAPATLKPGYYNYLFEVSQSSTCDQKQLLFQMIDPIMTISPTYSVDCLGGIAEFKVTNVGASNILAPFYFPISHMLTSSTSSFTSTGTTTTPDVVSISQIPVGTYTVTLDPASQYACPKTIGFNISTQPLSVLSATISTTAACSNQSVDGNATISLTNDNINLYYPISYTINKIVGATSSFVSSGTLTTTTKTFYGLASGTYSIVLDPQADGCVQNSNFNISVSETPCTLQQTLKKFSGKNKGSTNEFNIEIDTDGILDKIHLESSLDGSKFIEEADIPFENKKGLQTITYSSPVSEHIFFRLELHDIYSRLHQSAIIKILNPVGNIGIKTYPNPIGDFITLSKFATKNDVVVVHIISASGNIFYEDRFALKTGNNTLKISTNKLPKGQYVLSMHKVSSGDRQSSIIIKY
jgi:hypothetical protein